MSRQQDRRLIRKGQGQVVRERQLIIDFLGLTMQVLHDEFGFGDKRLKRYGQRVNDNLDCINADYVTFADILENLNMKEG